MNPAPGKALSFLLATISLGWAGGSLAATTNSWRLEAGPLTLEIHVSKTAHLFHVVDQISQWSEFCHRQYSRCFEALDGGLNAAERERLAQHIALRKMRGARADLLHGRRFGVGAKLTEPVCLIAKPDGSFFLP